ncbi:MAG: RtcB family protein [Okeania sp. SIO3B3]|nr:RtcB family protein [Okeania sp. SIO3B3]
MQLAETLLADNLSRVDVLAQLARLYQTPEDYQTHSLFGSLAQQLTAHEEEPPAIRDAPVPYQIWGDGFEDETVRQLERGAQLPIAYAGALMPDGHPGYGLPIGGVLATENSVIPYGVGVDIACRLRLSILAELPEILKQQPDRLRKALQFNTRFGIGRDGEWDDRNQRDHPLLDDPRWDELPLLSHLHEKAVRQMGTSGTSNHFAEWAALDVLADAPHLGLTAGEQRLCFVTHSGSRGVGFAIAQEYTRIARDAQPHLPKQYQELAWLDLDSEAGQEYWLAMHVAGDFASACHEVIHKTVLAAAGLETAAFVENHHNFAWEEEHHGRKMIVHRKGATPAGEGVLGVIPGTMADKGYIVVGLGNEGSLKSSSHGAGRPRSRSASKQMITRSQRDAYLKERGVELINPDAGVDEAPQAYKDPALVMSQQQDLARPLATFQPLMVMMASDDKFGRKRNKGKGGGKKGGRKR